jgi:nucleoside-diphosphate-sugar epimerase
MKVLVTGGGGFLGTTICRQLAVAGHTVAAFQRTPATHLITAGVESVEGDIRDTDAVGTAVAGCDAVIHCAAYASLWGKADLFESINVGGTTNVLDACRESGVRQVVYTSSPSVVLNGEDIEGGDESLPMVSEPLMPYQATKIVADRMVRKANAPGLRTVVLRPHLMWGPGDPHFLPRLIDRAINDRLFLPAPEKKSDVVFVENGARAHVQALMELNSGARCAGKAYFVTNNAPQLQGEFIQRLLTAVGINARIRKIPPALARMAGRSMEACWRLLRIKSEPLLTRFMAEQLCTSHWFDGSAARRDFGYVAPISIDQGLEIMARQFKH